VTRDERRSVDLPAGARWFDYWDDSRALPGGTTVDYAADDDKIPLFIREGALIPLQVSDDLTGHGDRGSEGWLTLLMYPGDRTERVFYPDDANEALRVTSERDGGAVSVTLSRSIRGYILRIKEPSAPSSIAVTRDGVPRSLAEMSTWEEFDRAEEGWYADPTNYLWVRFATIDDDAVLRYDAGV